MYLIHLVCYDVDSQQTDYDPNYYNQYPVASNTNQSMQTLDLVYCCSVFRIHPRDLYEWEQLPNNMHFSLILINIIIDTDPYSNYYYYDQNQYYDNCMHSTTNSICRLLLLSSRDQYTKPNERMLLFLYHYCSRSKPSRSLQ